MTYCDYCRDHPDDPWHVPYHDRLYGFPIDTDAELFERLVLEINQAGLSWLTILKKPDTFRQAYSGFDIDTVAAYSEADRQRLLANPGMEALTGRPWRTASAPPWPSFPAPPWSSALTAFRSSRSRPATPTSRRSTPPSRP